MLGLWGFSQNRHSFQVAVKDIILWISIGYWQRRGDRPCVPVGPAISDRHDGFHSQDWPRIERGRTSGEDNAVWVPWVYIVQTPDSETSLPLLALWLEHSPGCTVRPQATYFQRVWRLETAHNLPDLTQDDTRKSAIYTSLADFMVAAVIAELPPKDEGSKLLRDKLAIIQEAQVAAVSAGFVATSNLQLLRQDALLQNFGFQPQVLSMVRTAPFEGSHVLRPAPKVLQQQVRTIRQADRMARSSVTFIQETNDQGSQRFSFRAIGFSEGSYYHSEDNHPGPVLSCRCRQGSPLLSRSSPAQEG